MKKLIAYLAGAAALGVTSAYAAAPDAVLRRSRRAAPFLRPAALAAVAAERNRLVTL